jgi:hypothetical protein
MKKKGTAMQQLAPLRNLIPGLIILALFIAGCNGVGSQDSGPAAIEAYLQALIAKDLNQMINLSCAEWESQARLEYESFSAVEVRLEELDCQSSGQEGTETLVICAGRIIASYGAEDLVIDLPERVFAAAEEGGQWRMCGYK